MRSSPHLNKFFFLLLRTFLLLSRSHKQTEIWEKWRFLSLFLFWGIYVMLHFFPGHELLLDKWQRLVATLNVYNKPSPKIGCQKKQPFVIPPLPKHVNIFLSLYHKKIICLMAIFCTLEKKSVCRPCVGCFFYCSQDPVLPPPSLLPSFASLIFTRMILV